MKYLLVKGKYGLGNRIQALCEAIVYAKLTNREIIVDWRDARYSDLKNNSFPLLFTSPMVDSSLKIPKINSVLPNIWNGFLDKDLEWMKEKFKINEEDVRKKFLFDMSELNHDEEVVVMFDSIFHRGLFERHKSKFPKDWPKKSGDALLAFLLRNYITAHEEIKERVKCFQKKYFSTPIIGVHIRYTDNLINKTRKIVYPGSYPPIINKLLKKIPNATIFLATDNETIEKEYKKKYPNLIVMQKQYPKQKNQPIHSPEQGTNRIEIAKQAISEMYLLSECDYLIYSSMSSFAECASLISKSSKRRLIDLANVNCSYKYKLINNIKKFFYLCHENLKKWLLNLRSLIFLN